ncbi:hypothetical protein D3C86_1472810 [compost metagenome]
MLGDEAGRDHALQGDALASLGEVPVAVGRVVFGAPQEIRLHRTFGQAQVVRVLVEIIVPRSLHAMGLEVVFWYLRQLSDPKSASYDPAQPRNLMESRLDGLQRRH